MDLKEIIKKVRDNAKLFGWVQSDGGISAWCHVLDKDFTEYVFSVKYNHKKKSKKEVIAVAEKLFGKNCVMDVLTERCTSEPFVVIKVK